MFENGKEPYSDEEIDDSTISSFLANPSNRLKKPPKCPESIWEITVQVSSNLISMSKVV